MEGGPTVKLYVDFPLRGGLTPLNCIVQGTTVVVISILYDLILGYLLKKKTGFFCGLY